MKNAALAVLHITDLIIDLHFLLTLLTRQFKAIQRCHISDSVHVHVYPQYQWLDLFYEVDRICSLVLIIKILLRKTVILFIRSKQWNKYGGNTVCVLLPCCTQVSVGLSYWIISKERHYIMVNNHWDISFRFSTESILY